MSPRNRLLIALAAVVWALFFMVLKPWQGDAHQRTAARVGLLFPKLQYQTEDVRKVVVSDGSSSVTLAMDDNGYWRVLEKHHPLDKARLMMLMENLAAITTLDTVSVNPEKHGVFGVAEGQGTRVQVYDANEVLLADWIAGSLRQQDIASGQKPVLEFYMRDGRSDVVYLSGTAIHPSADPTVWCDTRFLFGVDSSRIQWMERIDFETSESWRIERTAPAEELPAQLGSAQETRVGGSWQLTAPKNQPALGYAGDSMAFTITGLEATDVVAQAGAGNADDTRYGFPQDRFRVGIDGQVFEFELGKPSSISGQRYLRVTNPKLPYIYSLDDYEVSQLRQPVARMLAESSAAQPESETNH
jgi:hypothetical protein